MDVNQRARSALATAVGVAGRVLPGRGKALDPTTPGDHGVQQTLTIARPARDVLAACRDAGVLSRLLGDLGRVERAGERYEWTLTAGGEEMSVVTDLVEVAGEGGAALEFRRLAAAERSEPGSEVDADPEDASEAVAHAEDDTEGGRVTTAPSALLVVSTGPAPRDLGTEVRAALDLPAGAVAFTLLYRLRALLQTGEIPTLRPQPAARRSER